ncbi:MAG: cystathionine gamma-synthase [Gammaproteobacteria bacterium]|nr:O-succinylhomoserine (thiol)-lyase [Chromatiales bacterium]MDP6675557.1 cystathionine gamma-synthase [Gammaproteobacteria bacterium]
MNKKDKARQTQAVRAGVDTDSQHGAVMPPVYLTTNFSFAGFEKPREYDYTRTGNPTRDALAGVLADLEGGFGATVTSSGMGAVTLACQMLNPDDLVVGPQDCYGGTFRLLNGLANRGLFNVRLVDQTDPNVLAAAVAEGAKMIWVESPTNPLLRIVDLAQTKKLAESVAALMVVDNTFLSPALQRPIEHGADLVVHSTTKYLNGHSDMVGGAVVAANEALHEQMQWWANALGLSGSPFDSFLTMRGVRTLYVRMQQHEKNATSLAEILSEHEVVGKVYYPGLKSHPGHQIATRQQLGFGGMLSFELKGGMAAARVFLETVELFTLAESLGGVESLAAHPATMTHATFDKESLAKAGISDGLVRLSVGIEATEDLVRDVLQGLEAAATVSPR